MDTQKIKTIVEAELGGWASSNEELLAAGNGPSSTAFQTRYITEIDIVNEADPADPLVGDGILAALEEMDVQHPMKRLVERVLKWLSPGDRAADFGVNVGDQNFRGQVAYLCAEGVLTAEQRDALLSMARPLSVWAANRLHGVAVAHIEEARQL